jgi:small subunit ribosomal protein S16
MSVRIRLSRIGKKHAPFYRVVSIDSRKKRDGAFLEDLGTFDAISSKVVRFDEEGYNRRLEQGAIPSDAVKKLYAQFKTGLKPVKKASKAASKTAQNEVAVEAK